MMARNLYIHEACIVWGTHDSLPFDTALEASQIEATGVTIFIADDSGLIPIPILRFRVQGSFTRPEVSLAVA